MDQQDDADEEQQDRALAALAGVLASEGYIEAYDVQDNVDKPGRTLHVKMKYSPERARTISGIKRVSKPGLRVYSPSTKVPRVLGGLGVAVLSTSQGLLSDREARRRKAEPGEEFRDIAGEVLACLRLVHGVLQMVRVVF